MDARQNHMTGTVSELKAATYFVEQGWEVFMPILTQSKADFLILKEGTVKKVQVKTATKFNCRGHEYLQVRIQGRRGIGFAPREYTLEDVDLIVVIYENHIWSIPYELILGNSSFVMGSIVDGELRPRTGRGFNSEEYKVK